MYRIISPAKKIWLGLSATVVFSACAAIDLHGELSSQLRAMKEAGVTLQDRLVDD